MPQEPVKTTLFVSQIVAGSGISINPAAGTGVVTISVHGSEAPTAITGGATPFPITGQAAASATSPGGEVDVAGAPGGTGAGGNGGAAKVSGGAAGAGSNGNGGDVVLTAGAHDGTGLDGNLVERSVKLVHQVAPTAATVSATLTAAQVLAGIITVLQGAAGASAQQLPLATAMDTALPNSVANDAFDFSVVNISAVAAESASITTNTGWTLVGDMDVAANSAATTKSAGRFRARKTAAGAWTLYRLS